MGFKMKGPSMYPGYKKAAAVGGEELKVARDGNPGASDGRAASSPFQMHDGTKHKATDTHFADGTKKTERDKFNDGETKMETLRVKKGSAADKKSKKKTSKDKTIKDEDYQNKKEALLNKGFTQEDADWMIQHGGE